MSIVATFTNPKQNYTGAGGCSASVPAESVVLTGDLGAISQAVLYIRSDVASKYSLETDDTNNPLQQNATVVITIDGVQWLLGYVMGKPYTKDFQEGRFLEVTCLGNEGVLAKTLVHLDGKYVYTQESDAVAVSAVPLKSTEAYGDFVGATLWPDPADTTGAKCYVQDASSNSDTLYTTITSGATPPFNIVLTTSNKGFGPRGWWKIDSEWFYCESYDDTGTGGRYQGKCTARAQLGTSAATHTAGATVYNKVAKQIAPRAVLLEKYEDSIWKRMRRDKEYWLYSLIGCFVLPSDDDGLTYRGGYSVYDEDGTLGGSTVYTLESVVTSMMKAARANGGPGFADGDLDFDTLGLGLNRYDHSPREKSPFTWQAIQDLIAAVGLDTEVYFWFDHVTGKFRLGEPTKAVSPDLTLTGLPASRRDVNLEDIASGVLLEYQDDQEFNYVHLDRSWHCGCAGSGAKPDKWVRVTEGGSSWDYGTHTDDTGAPDSNFGMDMLHDGKPDSKLVAEFSHDPGGDFVFGDWWFGTGTTPPLIELTSIGLRAANYRCIEGWSRTRYNTAYTYHYKFQGCTDYNTSMHTGTWEDLGFEIEGTPDAEGTPQMYTASAFCLKYVNAVRLVMMYMPGWKVSGDKYWGIVHCLEIKGSSYHYVFIQTSDSVQQDADYVYAPDAHEKLRGGVGASSSAGVPRCIMHSIGPSSDAAAGSIGRNVLKLRLAFFDFRDAQYPAALTGKPELGKTVALDEDGDTVAEFTGVVYGYRYACSGDGRNLELRLRDPDGAVIA